MMMMMMMASTTAAATAPPRPGHLHLRSPPPSSSARALLPRSFPSLRTCVAPLSRSHPHPRSRHLSVRCNSGLSPELKSTLDKVVNSNKVLLFMKGTKDFPQCGFSHTVVQILKSLNVPFETLDVLSNEALRQGLKEYSSWPTFPQLYIDGEFFGGCDIIVDAYKSGELQELLEKSMLS
ncbi:hypothetical protein LUZ63_004476 [Rhynchospora breviuscula]|uniref:Glutaredoxin domain-containing protein n=1 Tax=Rhynchospora breviuscula TaxID=2022672 RepID=A0A9Q0I042_9POAL|nr:hypothetical protein LUZ63_004476 [Rhynchospora breviuscula]